MLRWICTLSPCLLLATPDSAAAQRNFRETFVPYNLVCQLSGEMGRQRITFHIEDVHFKMLYLPSVILGSKMLDVETFDANTVKGSMKGGVPGLDPNIDRAEFNIDRNTGEITASYRSRQCPPSPECLPIASASTTPQRELARRRHKYFDGSAHAIEGRMRYCVTARPCRPVTLC